MVCEYEPPIDTLNLSLELEEYEPVIDTLNVELDLCPGITLILEETATMLDLGEEDFNLTGLAKNQEVTDQNNPSFWSNIANIETKNDDFASQSAGGTGTFPTNMHMLATTLGFDIPGEAVLRGVEIRYEAQKASSDPGSLVWRLFTDDTNALYDTITEPLNTDWTVHTIGSPTERFGWPEITAAQVNSADFAPGVRFTGGTGFDPNTGRVRWIEVKAYWQYKKVWKFTTTTKTQATSGMIDGDFRDVTRVFTEANSMSEEKATEWTLERLHEETNTLSDQTKKTSLKALQEAITHSDEATKTLIRSFTENLLHEDSIAKELTRLYIEATGGMADELRKTPIKNLLETNTLIDDLVITKELIRILTENNNLSDGDIRQTTRVLEEVLNHADTRTKATDKTFEEENLLSDIKTLLGTRTFTEEHEMTDGPVFLARLLLLSEVMNHEDQEPETVWNIVKELLEDTEMTDQVNNVLILTKELLETAELFDGDFRSTTKVINEVINATDNIETEWTLFKQYLETTEMTDNVTRGFVKFLTETAEANDIPITKEVMKSLEELAEMSDEPAVLAKLFKPKLKLLKNIDPRLRASMEKKTKLRKAGYEQPKNRGGGKL